MCVKHLNRCKTCTFMIFVAGGWRGHMRLHPTKLLIWSQDITRDAWWRTCRILQNNFSVEFLVDGSRLCPEPACRCCNSIPFCYCFYYWRNSNQLKTRDSTSLALAMVVSTTFCRLFGIWKRRVSSYCQVFPSSLIRISWSVFARLTHSTSQFDKTSLSKCVTHAGFDRMTWALRGIPF